MTSAIEPRLRVVVIGAGIIGTCCALRLQREGHKVILVDREEPGMGCSFGNAGAISPSAVIPMALPGMLPKVPKWLADPEGPLSVRLRYLPKAAPWLARWILASRASVATAASHALHTLNSGTLDGYRELLSAAQYQDIIRPSGHLYVWRQQPNGTGDRLAQALRDAYGIRTELLGSEELRQLEPRLSPDLQAGLLFPDNSQTRNPQRLVQLIAGNFLDEGGTILKDEVHGFDIGPGGPTHVVTRTTRLPTDAVVIAAGAFSRSFACELAIDIPLETERGYHIMLSEPSVMPRLPIMFGDYKFYATPMEHGLRLAGTVEFAGLDAPPRWSRANVLLSNARKALPGLEAKGSTVWMGRRPSIPDSVPVIDKSPRYANVFFAFGHGHLGLSGGPGTSRLVSDMINNRRPFIDPTPFMMTRFNLFRSFSVGAARSVTTSISQQINS